ncbi:collagen alpha-1(XII) chain-like [Hydractinia symbiolongicarpus]|uniref:collagen alpha-1(XII) chain-like n=1 Tax=Hydractinia symbiolongicarpus TaxID=13093 RepID=UPI0025507CD6|nr:collagen alpha-1(XII) chain-like [Hydractinia symbiolongicarpus]
MSESSKSTAPEIYQKTLEFMASITKAFDIQEKGTSVAVIQYATNAKVIFDFNKFKGKNISKEKVVNEIMNIPPSNGDSTRMEKALKLGLKVFREEHGSRKNVSKIAILMTDGVQTYTLEDPRLLETSKELQKAGVHVYTVGVGVKNSKSELKAMASDLDSTFISDNIDDLVKIGKKLTKKICEDFHPTTTKPSITTPVPVSLQVRALTTLSSTTTSCPVALDLGILIDVSETITDQHFEEIKEFVAHIINEFDIKEEGTHVGVITFSTNPRLEFDFKRLKGRYTKGNVMALISRIKHLKGMTRIDRALALAKTKLFSSKGGARPDKSQGLNSRPTALEANTIPQGHQSALMLMFPIYVAVILTDGVQSEEKESPGGKDPKLVAQPLKDAGVKIYTIAIGGFNLGNLVGIASDPSKVLRGGDFGNLLKEVNHVTDAVCKDEKELTTTISPTTIATTTTPTTTEAPKAEEFSTLEQKSISMCFNFFTREMKSTSLCSFCGSGNIDRCFGGNSRETL